MKAGIYKTAHKNTSLFLPQGTAFSAVPQSTLDKLGSVQFWKTVELAPNIIGVHPDNVVAAFKEQGYFVGSVEVKTSVDE